MAKSLTIKNKNNLILYPKTVSSLVYDNSTGNTVKQDLDSLVGQVAELLGVENAFFGGIVGASTDIATDYSNNGYSGTYLYMVGTDMSSLVAYQYTGSGSPTQLFGGTTYDFTDYSEIKQVVAALDEELYGRKVYNGYTAGKYIVHSTGSLKANENYAYTDYIPVPASAEIRAVYKFANTSGVAAWGTYNSSKGFISTYTASNYANERTATIGDTAAFIRVNLNVKKIDECIVYVNGEVVWFHTGRVSNALVERTEDITGVDETPIKDSTNVVQSGGVYNEFEDVRDSIKQQGHTKRLVEIPLWDYYGNASTSYINMTDNAWKTSSGSQGLLLSIRSNTKYRITANAVNASRYALLTDNDQTTNARPHYATGETLYSLAAGTVKEFITPDDARYIFLQYTLSGNDATPSLFEEEVTISDALDTIQRLDTDTVLFHLKRRYMVDARVDSVTFGKVIYCISSSTGNPDWGCSQLIDVSGASYVRYYANTKSTSNNFAGVTGAVFYDKDEVPMTDGIRLIEKDDAAASGWVIDPVPNDAKYMRICVSYSKNLNPNYYIRLYKLDVDDIYGLKEQVEDYNILPLVKNSRYGISESATPTAVTSDIINGTVSFLHFSDIHSDRDAAKAIRAFYDKYSDYITDMLSTGDAVYYKHTDDFTFYTDNNLTDALFALGNHDGNSNSGWNGLGRQATYEKYFAPYIDGWNVTQPTGAAESFLMYYYKDYTPANVRLIVLDGQYQTSAQLQWFTDTLADANTLGYTVVVASHYVPSTFIEDGVVKKPDGEMVTFQDIEAPSLTTIDTSFKLSTSYADAVSAFIEGGGKFAVWLCGHYHRDILAYSSTHPNILFCAINQAGYMRGGTRGSRSIGDHCANLVTIHPRSSLIKIVRVGLKSDRYLRQINVLTYQYSSRKVFTNF